MDEDGFDKYFKVLAALVVTVVWAIVLTIVIIGLVVGIHFLQKVW